MLNGNQFTVVESASPHIFEKIEGGGYTRSKRNQVMAKLMPLRDKGNFDVTHKKLESRTIAGYRGSGHGEKRPDGSTVDLTDSYPDALPGDIPGAFVDFNVQTTTNLFPKPKVGEQGQLFSDSTSDVYITDMFANKDYRANVVTLAAHALDRHLTDDGKIHMPDILTEDSSRVARHLFERFGNDKVVPDPSNPSMRPQGTVDYADERPVLSSSQLASQLSEGGQVLPPANRRELLARVKGKLLGENPVKRDDSATPVDEVQQPSWQQLSLPGS